MDDDNIVCENSTVIIKTSKAILDSAYRCMCAHVEVSMVLHIRIMCSVKVMRFLIFLFWKNVLTPRPVYVLRAKLVVCV